jgi:hypothetical protein
MKGVSKYKGDFKDKTKARGRAHRERARGELAK